MCTKAGCARDGVIGCGAVVNLDDEVVCACDKRIWGRYTNWVSLDVVVVVVVVALVAA